MSGTLPQIEMEPKLKIILVGKTNVGKTSVMNTLLGRDDQSSGASSCSRTTECEMEKGKHDGQELDIIDTPGVNNTEKTKKEVKKEIAKSIAYAALDGGPHVFLLVMRWGAISMGDRKAVEILQKMFGDKFKDYTLVLFTSEKEQGKDVNKHIKDNELFKKFIDEDHPYHFFQKNGTKTEKEQKVSDLVKKINNMVAKNKEKNGPRYTSDMMKEAKKIQEAIEKEKPKADVKEILVLTAEKIVKMFLGDQFMSSVYDILKI